MMLVMLKISTTMSDCSIANANSKKIHTELLAIQFSCSYVASYVCALLLTWSNKWSCVSLKYPNTRNAHIAGDRYV